MVLQMSISDRIYLILARETNKGGFVEVSKPELGDMHRAAVIKELELRRVEKQLEKVAANQGLELRRVETQFEKWKDFLDYQTDGLNDQIGRFVHIVMPQGNQPPEKDWRSDEMERVRRHHHISPAFLVETQPEDTSNHEELEVFQSEEEQTHHAPQGAPIVQVLANATSTPEPPAKTIRATTPPIPLKERQNAQVSVDTHVKGQTDLGPQKAPIVQVLTNAISSSNPPAEADRAPTRPIPPQEIKSAQVSNPAAKAPVGDENHMMRSILSACVLFATFIVLTLYKLNQQYHIFPPIRRIL